MRNNTYLFETSFIFKHSYSKNNICIAHSFLHNRWRNIGPSMVFLIQSLEGKEDKFCIICNNNPNCKRMTNIISHYTQVFKSRIQHKNNHIVSFRKFEAIHEIKERPQNWATSSCMLTPSFFTFMHMSISSKASTLACNSNFSLVNLTYNLITKAKTLDNNQYSEC